MEKRVFAAGFRLITPLIQWGIGGLFLYSGITKLLDPRLFASQIGAYQLVPVGSELLMASLLIWTEIILGGGLMLGLWDGVPGILTMALLILFTAAVASAWARGLNIDCGCSGAASQPVGIKKILENCALILANGWWLYRKDDRWSI